MELKGEFVGGEKGNDPEDRHLIEQAAHGDPSSQHSLLVRLHQLPLIVARLNRLHGNALSDHEIADVLQDVYCNLWRRLPAFHGRCAFETWAFAFAHRLYQGALRRRFAKPRSLGDSVFRVPARPLRYDEVQEELTSALSALSELNPLDASFVFKRIFEGRTFGAIAREAQHSTSMVKSRFYRSVTRLRGLLKLRRVLDSIGERE